MKKLCKEDVSQGNIPEGTIKDTSVVSNRYEFPIDGPIEESDKYTNLFNILRNASPEDVVFLHINTEGGVLSTAQQICVAMNACEAPVYGFVSGECSSAGTLIAFSCDALWIDDDSSWLLHTGAYSCGGIAPHIESAVEHNKVLMKRIAEKHYKNILSEEEISRLLKGDQLYFFGDEISKRVENRNLIEQEESKVKEETCFANLENLSIEELEELVDQANELLMEKYEALDGPPETE